MLTQEYLKSVLHYNELTGIFTWIKTVNSRAVKGSLAGCRRKSDGRLIIAINGKRYYSYQLAWLYVTSKFPDVQIDHKDRNASNDIFSNLRECNNSQNNQNKSHLKHSKLKLKGISFYHGKYVAILQCNGHTVRIGRFDDIESAVAAYNKAAIKHHGDFAVLN